MKALAVAGNNHDVRSFLNDLPVKPGEKVVDFLNTFHDNPELRQVVQGLYSVKIVISNNSENKE